LPLQIGYHIYYHFFYRVTLLRAKAIIAVSHATRWDLEDCLGIPRERIFVIHESIDERFKISQTPKDVTAIHSRFQLPDTFLLYLGATLPHKNLANLLKGYKRALETGTLEGVSLLLAGRTSRFDVELEQLIKGLGIQNLVRRIGYVPQEDLAILYAMSKAFVYMSRYEGFGFPPLEAMHHGVPVLVAYHASLPEVVGACGLFVDPDDIEGIARAILTIVHNSELRHRLASMGRDRLTRFSWQKAAMETIRIYEQVYLQ
jgi:glycosyltransferase involved in cell wall biosynthesis